MDSDQEMRVEDAEPIAWPTAGKGKGKAKATAQDEPHDLENLPWYDCRMTLPFASPDIRLGWRSTDR